jgi:hypothetical protein
MHKSDRDVQAPLEFARKEVSNGGKTVPLIFADRGRGTDLPGCSREGQGLEGHLCWNDCKSDLRMVGGSNFCLSVGRTHHTKLHIGLATANPDISNEHVIQNALVWAVNRDFVRSTDFRRLNFHRPLAIPSSHSLALLSSDRHRDRFSGRRPSPEGIWAPSLKDHVVGKDWTEKGSTQEVVGDGHAKENARNEHGSSVLVYLTPQEDMLIH